MSNIPALRRCSDSRPPALAVRVSYSLVTSFLPRTLPIALVVSYSGRLYGMAWLGAEPPPKPKRKYLPLSLSETDLTKRCRSQQPCFMYARRYSQLNESVWRRTFYKNTIHVTPLGRPHIRFTKIGSVCFCQTSIH